MEILDTLPEEQKKAEKNIGRKERSLENDSIQYNRQDLDQEQKVDVNPLQLNTQNLHIHLKNDKINFCGKITGITCIEKNKELAKNANILLYFGHDCRLPVYKTNSDNNGNFVIEDIPPGYYTLYAEFGDILKYQSHYIKVLPGQNVYQSILLK